MIFVHRDRPGEDGAPITPGASWASRAEAATRNALMEGAAHEADRSVYAADEVRAALEKVFHDKCAYCESHIAATHDWDVDHFRPKGAVAERRDHPGYYWLSYDWTNLFPSCTHCNQRRRDKPRWGDLMYAVAGGKLHQFPLEDETSRALGPGRDCQAELTLLINPCMDRPEWYLGFDARGHAFAIPDDGEPNPYAEATIAVFNLNRRRLRDARLRQMEFVKVVVRRAETHRRSGGHDTAKELLQFCRESFLDPSAEYAGASGCVYRQTLRQLA